MRRALAILKYLPAVLCGLLVVAWVVSFVWSCNVAIKWPNTVDDGVCIGLWTGCVFGHNCICKRTFEVNGYKVKFVGKDEWRGRLVGPSYACPIPFLLTLLLPLAIGSFTRFRFPLWSWFAFTALVAVELAYYLRVGF